MATRWCPRSAWTQRRYDVWIAAGGQRPAVGSCGPGGDTDRAHPRVPPRGLAHPRRCRPGPTRPADPRRAVRDRPRARGEGGVPRQARRRAVRHTGGRHHPARPRSVVADGGGHRNGAPGSDAARAVALLRPGADGPPADRRLCRGRADRRPRRRPGPDRRGGADRRGSIRRRPRHDPVRPRPVGSRRAGHPARRSRSSGWSADSTRRRHRWTSSAWPLAWPGCARARGSS